MSGKIAFTPERMDRFKKLVAKYEVPQCALLPTMYLAQEQWGWMTPEAMDYVATLVDVPPRQVREVASFYGMFYKKDMGKHCLQVCVNVTCTMMGSEKLVGIIRDELKIGPNEVTEDKQFSYMPVQCLGSCDTAPVVQVNEDYVESLDPQKFRDLLSKLRSAK